MCCPVCGKEEIQGFVCDTCGFDFSRDYEGRRTLCSALPGDVKTISARKSEWERRHTATRASGQQDNIQPQDTEEKSSAPDDPG